MTTVTLGHRSNLYFEEEYLCHVYYPIIDRVLGKLTRRFSEYHDSCPGLLPNIKNYLKFEALKRFLDLYESKLPSEESIKLELIHAERVIE